MDRELINQLYTELQEIHSLVWAEAPHLLGEDRGGRVDLDLNIEDVLEKAREYLAAHKSTPTGGTH
jgi:hypothetical protein